MTIVQLDSAKFPAFIDSVHAHWVPVFLTPIRGSEERLVIGVAVFNSSAFHIEPANALSRLHCLYGSQADIVIQVAGIALDELTHYFIERPSESISNFHPSISGVHIGAPREGEGVSLQAIGVSWMGALSSLYDANSVSGDLSSTNPDLSFEEQFSSSTVGDRLPILIRDYVINNRAGLARYFQQDIDEKPRRRRSYEVFLDFTGSKLVANFGTLQAGRVTSSVDLIKRRLWDLKVDRDSEKNTAFERKHEMLIQMPSADDPQISKKQFENLNTAREALEQQADQEELRLESFTSVAEIGERILTAEQ